jgi:hypothetical protein
MTIHRTEHSTPEGVTVLTWTDDLDGSEWYCWLPAWQITALDIEAARLPDHRPWRDDLDTLAEMSLINQRRYRATNAAFNTAFKAIADVLDSTRVPPATGEPG